MLKIVADRDIPFLKGVLEPFAEVVYLRGDVIGPADVRDADAILTRTRTKCNAALLDGSRVSFIGTATIGFDHIDMSYCASRGIAVATAAGCNKRGVLQWVSAVLARLIVGRPAGVSAVDPAEFPSLRGAEPAEITLGVVGVGNVGSLIKKYAESWGFRVMCSDPPRERAERLGEADGFYPLDEIIPACDIITFHVPLIKEGPDATQHLVGRGFLEAAKPGAVILNSSRGPVLEPGALREAVAGGGRFVIDTWNGEPDIDRAVLAGVIFGTPHIAGYSAQGKANGTAMVVNALACRFGLDGLRDWFPDESLRSVPEEISWEDMCRTMPSHFDIDAESALLKSAPERFEAFRDNYNYRNEYF